VSECCIGLSQITNFYGATNDEYSQPRHCWDPSGKYIYGVKNCYFAYQCICMCSKLRTFV